MPSALDIALYAGVLGIAYIYRYTFVLAPLFYNEADTVLTFPLPEFTGLKYWTLYIYFITRSILRRLPFLAQKRLSPTSKDENENSYIIPGNPISLEIPFYTSPADLIRYNRAAKTSGIDTISHPLHLVLFLSAATEPAMLLLLTKINCPMDPIGGVNVRNRFEIVDGDLLREKLKEVMSEEGVMEQGWKVKTRLDPNLKKVKRGWEVTIVVEMVWGNDILYRQFFTFLQFAKHSIPVSSEEKSNDPEITPTASIRLTSNDPYLWATLSKDYNPIHFSSILAKVFGFKSMIAHGNHVLAKGLAKLDLDGEGTKFMEVEFRRPAFLPSELHVSVDEGERIIVLGNKGKASVVARYG